MTHKFKTYFLLCLLLLLPTLGEAQLVPKEFVDKTGTWVFPGTLEASGTFEITGGKFKFAAVTFANLPASPVAGWNAIVTDMNATCDGGGSTNVTWVRYTGTAWACVGSIGGGGTGLHGDLEDRDDDTASHPTLYPIYTLVNGAPVPGAVPRGGALHLRNTSGLERCYFGVATGGNYFPCDINSDAINTLLNGVNSIVAAGNTPVRVEGANGIKAEVFHKAATAYTNQPTNDGVEILSSTADTQTVRIYGTVSGGAENVLVFEDVILNGTTPVPSIRVNWNNLVAHSKGVTTGIVTIRKATGDGTITTMAPATLYNGNKDTAILVFNPVDVSSGVFPAARVITGSQTVDRCLRLNASSQIVVHTGDCGGAGGGITTLHTFRPQQNDPPAANFATLDTRNGHPVLDFDSATEESAIFSDVMNRGYLGGDLLVKLHYSMTSAITLEVILCAQFERIGDGQQDIDADGFAAARCTAATTVPGTSGHVDIVSITFTSAQADAIAVGEGFRLKVYRDADDAGDDAAGDLELRFVEVHQ